MGKFLLKLESFQLRRLLSLFPISCRTFQLRSFELDVVGKGSWKKREVRNEIRKNEVGNFKPKLGNF